MSYIIDTHSHIYGEEYDEDLDLVIERAKCANVSYILMPNIDEQSLGRIENTCQKYSEMCFPMIGLHPENLSDKYEEQLALLEEQLCKNPSHYIAIGEIGLDYYWDATKKEEQKNAFIKQLEWSIRYHKPVSIHSRSSFLDLVEILDLYQHQLPGGVFHCFSGTEREAQKLLSYTNFYLGIGGILTFKKQKLAEVLLNNVPLSKIVLETDAPYLTPEPFRGKRNESCYIIEIAKKISSIYNVSIEEVAKVTTENATKVFNLPFK